MYFVALSWGSDSGNKPNANKKPEMDSEHQDSAEKHLMPTFFYDTANAFFFKPLLFSTITYMVTANL